MVTQDNLVMIISYPDGFMSYLISVVARGNQDYLLMTNIYPDGFMSYLISVVGHGNPIYPCDDNQLS